MRRALVLLLCCVPLLLGHSNRVRVWGRDAASGASGGTSGSGVALFDADGDGSGFVTCNDVGDPLPWCKASGERIYGDFADDFNTMLRIAADPADTRVQMGDTVQLEEAVYVIAPCWEPTNTVHDYSSPYDPGQRDDHPLDGSPEVPDEEIYNDLCPEDQHGNKSWSMNWQNIQLNLRGRGTDERLNSQADITARAEGRTRGTYIVNDAGIGDANDPSAEWFGVPRWGVFVFGYDNTLTINSRTGTGLFGHPDFLGASTVGAAYDPETDLVGELCICDNNATCGSFGPGGGAAGGTDWIANAARTSGLEPGELLYIKSTNDPAPGNDESAAWMLRFNGVVGAEGDCAVGHERVEFGYYDASNDLSIAGVRAAVQTVPMGQTDLNVFGADVYHVPESMTSRGTVEISNLTFEHQNFHGEEGGLCASTCDGSDPCIYALGVENSEDCDTRQVIQVWANADFRFKDVVFKHSGSFMVDGAWAVAFPKFENVTIAHRWGSLLFDHSARDRWRGTRIIDSHFGGDSLFGGGTGPKDIQGVEIYGTTFSNLQRLDDNASPSIYKDFYIHNSSFQRLFLITGGAFNNIIENFRIRGRINSSTTVNSLIEFQCANGCDDIYGNQIGHIIEEPPHGEGSYGAPNHRSVYVQFDITTEADWDHIYDNRIHNNYKDARTGTVGSHRMIVNQNPTTAIEQQVFEVNWFENNVCRGCDRVFGVPVGGNIDATIEPRGCGNAVSAAGSRTATSVTEGGGCE